MEPANTMHQPARRLVDASELAAVLDVSPEMVKHLHRGGAIPAYRTGKRLRFDVDECLARLRVESNATRAQETGS